MYEYDEVYVRECLHCGFVFDSPWQAERMFCDDCALPMGLAQVNDLEHQHGPFAEYSA